MTEARFTDGDQIEVRLTRPVDHGFDYRVPAGMCLQAGDYVQVPLGGREMLGIVWGAGRQQLDAAKVKPVTRLLTHLPPMTDAMRDWLDWVADYTLSPRGLVLKMALPIPDAALKPPSEVIYHRGHGEAMMTPARQRVLAAIEASPQPRRALRALEGVSPAILSGMEKAGLLVKDTRILREQTKAHPSQPAPALRGEQQQAADQLRNALTNDFSVLALEGVTGSGKTEVYFDSIEQILEQKEGQILVLLPEIALTSQWMERFAQRFGSIAQLWHSSVPLSKRKSAWHRIATGAARLVVGARSALFLPYADLRLIVVDEEHEASYKQEEGVLYHARDMAVARARHEQRPCLLCSASLSLETQQNIACGKYRHLQLRERHGRYREPTPELIDLRADKPESGDFLSPTLRAAIAETLHDGHQAMLFLNRRGYAPLLLCRHCGHRFACDNCSAWMVRHTSPPRLQCHHCDWRAPLPTHCPECGSDELAACGPGVERIAEEAATLFPDAPQAMLSSDAGDTHEQIDAILSGEARLIIGTQMIAKGHHFPHLALVGVVDADLGLMGGDLRAGERSFQLLHQLAGRCRARGGGRARSAANHAARTSADAGAGIGRHAGLSRAGDAAA